MSADLTYTVGQRVRAKKAVFEDASDEHPAGYLCREGDLLIVRDVREGGEWPISVSHEDITDATFAVAVDEITPEQQA